MGQGIRLRLIALLLSVVLPVTVAGFVALNIVEGQLAERIEADLENSRRLEAARVSRGLSDYERYAKSLASGWHVVSFLGAVETARSDHRGPPLEIGGLDGFSPVDPFSPRPLQDLVVALQSKSERAGSEVRDIRIVGSVGQTLGETDGFSWEPYDQRVVDAVLGDGAARFGNAFRSSDGDDRLGLVTPVLAQDGSVIGALLVESRLGPIVDLVLEHEGFDETSEAHLAQPLANGNAEFITPLRFARDSAFTKVVPADRNLPINQSLRSPAGKVVWAQDYRATDSILAIQTIPATGWGLVVKIDQAEALAPVSLVRRTIVVAGLVSLAFAAIGSIMLLQPIGRRLRQAAAAAERIAGGDYLTPIGDKSRDEIGAMSRSIDQLAKDLTLDIGVRAAVEDRLVQQATHDELTALHNRQFASVAMEELHDAAIATQRAASVLFLDLDGFKAINDTYGHSVGDEILVIVASRLTSLTGVDSHVTVARWGGDEFVMLLPDTDHRAAHTMADRVHRIFEEAFVTSAGHHVLRCSVGCSVTQSNGSVKELIHRADTAMFSEKQRRKGDRRISPSIVRTVEQALETGRLEVWYQPVVGYNELDDVRLLGAEALLRLRTEANEVLTPGFFLEEIQRLQLGVAVDRHVMSTAMAQGARWLADRMVPDDFQISLNLGEAAMRDPALPRFVEQQLVEHNIGSHHIVMEISEKIAELRPQAIEEIARLGVRFALDDVGLQHSNLDRLVDVPASIAKIDQRWIAKLEQRRHDPAAGRGRACSETETPTVGDDGSHRDMLVLDHLVALCRDLHLEVVAEGVESQAQVAVLRTLGINAFQGYFFGRPMPAAVFSAEQFAVDAR